MALDVPEDADTERALWQKLTAEMLQRIVPDPDIVAAPDGSTAAAKGTRRRSSPSASQRTGADR